MNENSYLNEAEMKTQSRRAVTILADENAAMAALKGSYINIYNDTFLTGKAALALKRQMFDYSCIIEAAMEANRSDIADHQTLMALLGNSVYKGSTILKNKQNAWDEKVRDEAEKERCYREYMDCAGWQLLSTDYYYYRYKWFCHEVKSDIKEYQEWKNKEDEYDSKDNASKGLFDAGVRIRNSFDYALDVIPLNFKQGQYQFDLKNDWKQNAVDAIKYRWTYYDRNGYKCYNFDAIAEMLQRDSSEVGYYEYLALCETFADMNSIQKADFIESAYIPSNSFYEYDVTDYSSGYALTVGTGRGVWKYEVSETFQIMALMYGYNYIPLGGINMTKSEINSLNDYSFLMNFAFLNPDLYVSGSKEKWGGLLSKEDKGDLEITISPITTSAFVDYNVHINAYDQAYMDNGVLVGLKAAITGEIGFTVYGYRHGLDYVFDQAAKKQIEGLRVDIDQEMAKHCLGVARDVLIGCIPDLPIIVGAGITIGQGVIDGVELYDQAVQINATVNSSINTLNNGNALSALGVSGTVIIDKDGKPYIMTAYIDPSEFKSLINQYKAETGFNIDIDYNIWMLQIMGIGGYQSTPQLEAFIAWVDGK